MSYTEEEIIRLKFDAQGFEQGVHGAATQLKELGNTMTDFTKKASDITGALKQYAPVITSLLSGLSGSGNSLISAVGKAAEAYNNLTTGITKNSKEADMSPISEGLDTVSEKFSAFETIATGALLKLGAQVEETAKNLVEKLTVDQIADGWEKFGQIQKATQTTLATGASLSDTETALKRLSWYADETSYSLTDMTGSIAKFTSYGIAIEDAAKEIMGIDNAVAKAGGTISQATSAQQAFQRAFSQGYMSLAVWRRQLTSSGLITVDFKEKCIEAGLAVGTLYQDVNGVVKSVNGDMEVTATGMENTLTKTQWMTKDVMEVMLKGYAESSTMLADAYDEFAGVFTTSEIMAIAKANNLADEYSLSAFRMSQEATTMSQAVESIFDASSTQWNKVFQDIFGNFYEARSLFTEVANWSVETFVGPVYALEKFMDKALKETVSWSEFYRDADTSLEDFIETQKDENEQIFITNNYIALLADSIYNVFRAIDSYIATFKAAWGTVFNSVTVEQAQSLVVSFHDFTESLILSEDQMIKLGKILQSVFTVIKVVKNVIINVVDVLKRDVWPVIKQVVDDIYDGIVMISETLTSFLGSNSIFSKLTGTIGDVRDAIVNASDDSAESTAALIKYLIDYTKSAEEAADATEELDEELNDSATVTKRIASNLEGVNWDAINSADIDLLKGYVKELENADDYMSQAQVSGLEFTEALSDIADAGLLTADDIEDLNDIIDDLSGTLGKTTVEFKELDNIKEAYDKIDWNMVTSSDLDNLENLVIDLEESAKYMNKTSEYGDDFVDVLDDISEQGYATASDIEKLNDAIEDMNESLYESTDYRTDANDKAQIMLKALQAMKGDGVITDSELKALESLQEELENTSGYTNGTAAAVNALEEALEEMAAGGNVTAEDIEGISDAISSLRSSARSDSGIDDLTESYSEATEGISDLLEEIGDSGKVTSAQVNEFQELYKQLKETTGESSRLTRQYNSMNRVLKAAARSGELTEDQYDSLVDSYDDLVTQAEKLNTSYTKSKYGTEEFTATIQNYSDSARYLGTTTQTVAEAAETVSATIGTANQNVSESSEVVTETSENVTETLTTQNETTQEVAESTETLATDTYDLAEATTEAEEAISPFSNALDGLSKVIDKIFGNATIGGVGDDKSFIQSLAEYIGLIDIADIGKVAIGAVAVIKVIKMILTDIGELGEMGTAIVQNSGDIFNLFGNTILKLAGAVAILMAADWAFGGGADAVDAIKTVVNKMIQLLLLVFAMTALTTTKGMADMIAIISSISTAIGALSICLAVFSFMTGKYGNAEDTIAMVDAVVSAISKMLKTLKILAILGSNKVIKDDMTDTLLALAVTVGAVGLVVSAIMLINSKTNNAEEAVSAVTKVLTKLTVALSVLMYISTTFGSDANLMNSAANLLLMMVPAILAAGIAIAAITLVDSDSSCLDAATAIRSVLEQLKDCIRDIIIIGAIVKSDGEILSYAEKAFIGAAAAILAIGVCLAAATYVMSIVTPENAILATTSIRSILEQIKDCIRDIIIVTAIVTSNNEVIEASAHCFGAIGVALFAVAACFAAMGYVSKSGGNISEIGTSIKDIIYTIGEVVDIMIATTLLSSERTAETLTAVGKMFLMMSAPILAAGVAVGIMTALAGKYGSEAINSAANTMEMMLTKLAYIAALIAFGQITNGGMHISLVDLSNSGILNTNSSWILKLAIFMVAVAASIAIITAVANKFGEASVQQAVDSIVLILDHMGGIMIALSVVSATIAHLGLDKAKTVKSIVKAFSNIGSMVLILAVAVAIMTVTAKLGGSDFDNAVIVVESMMWSVAAVSVVLAAVSTIIKGEKKEFEIMKNSITALSAAVLTVTMAVAIIAASSALFGSEETTAAFTDCIAIMTALVALVVALAYASEVIQVNVKALSALAISAVVVSVAMVALSGAIAIISSCYSSDWIAALSACVSLVVILGVLVGVVELLGLIGTQFKAEIGALLTTTIIFAAISGCMLIIADAICSVGQAVKSLNSSELTSAAINALVETLTAVLAVVAGLAIIGKYGEASVGPMLASAVVFAIISACMIPMTTAFERIADTVDSVGGKVTAESVAALAGVLAAVFGVVVLLCSIGSVAGAGVGVLVAAAAIAAIGASLIPLAYGINLVATALKTLQSVDDAKVGTVLKTLAGSLGIVIVGIAAIVGLAFAAKTVVVGIAVIIAALAGLAGVAYILAGAIEKVLVATAVLKGQGVDDVSSAMSAMTETIDKTVSSIGDDFEDAGEFSVDGFCNGIEDNLDSVADAGESIGDTAAEAAQESLDIHSPSRVFGKFGEYTVQGFANGINDNIEIVDEAGTKIGTMAADGTVSALDENDPYGIGGKYVGDIVDGVKDGSYKMSDATEDTVNNATEAGKTASSSAKEIGTEYMDQVGEGFDNAIEEEKDSNKTGTVSNKIAGFFGYLWEDIKSSFKGGQALNENYTGESSLSIDTTGLTESLTTSLTSALGGDDEGSLLETMTSGITDAFSDLDIGIDTDDIGLSFDTEGMMESLTEGLTVNTDTTSLSEALTGIIGTGYSNVSTDEAVSQLDTDTINSLMTQYGITSGDSYVEGVRQSGIADHTGSTGLAAVICEGITGAQELISDVFNNLGKTSLDVFASGFIENLFSRITSFSELLEEIGVSIKDTIFAPFANIFEKFKEYGSNIISGLTNGVKNGIKKVKNIATNVGSTFLDTFRSILGIASPSKEMIANGEYIVQGLTKGINSNLSDAEVSSDKLGNTVLTSIKSAVETATSLAENDMTISPTITPVVDMSNVTMASGAMEDLLSNQYIAADGNVNASNSAIKNQIYRVATASSANVNAMNAAASANQNGSNSSESGVTYIQNNYSPKELSAIDVYRQTRNQLNQRTTINRKYNYTPSSYK